KMIDGSDTKITEKKPSKKPASKQYKGNSIVDYLDAIGSDSSFTHRKRLANNYGISRYKGTARQNRKLLKLLRNGKTKTSSRKGKLKVDGYLGPKTIRAMQQYFG